jgi:hypothetical protein
MLIITESDILCLSSFIGRSVKNEKNKELLLNSLALKKPALSKGLLLLLTGADFNFIQDYTRMPDGYFSRFLANFYDLHGIYPELVFMFPALRTDAEVMRQVYFTAGLKKKFDFLKEVEKVLSVYDRLTRVAGKIIVPLDKHKVPEEDKEKDKPEKENKPTELLNKLDELDRLDKTADNFLKKYDYSEKVQFIEAMSKDPKYFVEKLFGKSAGRLRNNAKPEEDPDANNVS